MTQPIAVEVRDGAAYIRYTAEPVVNTQDVTKTGSVAADVDAAGRVVGIEILDLVDGAQIAIAKGFARDADLAFPRDLAGVLVPS